MNFYSDESSYKYLFLIFALIVAFIDSGYSRQWRYILPILPGTHYTLYDVIILPENRDVVEITITAISTSKELASLNITAEHEVRLGYAVTLHNISIESGLKLVISYKIHVVLDLPGGLLKLPSISDYGKLYHVLTLTVHDLDIPLVIQSDVPDTSMKVCGIKTEDEMMTQNLKETSKKDISINNCSTLITSRTGRYSLNDTFGFQIIKITSEHPISILQGRGISLPNSNKNKQNISYPFASRLYWQASPSLSSRTHKIIVVPSQNRRDYTFWIISPNKCVVEFKTNNSSTTINLTSNKATLKNVNIPAQSVLTVTGSDEYSLHCVTSANSSCNAELFTFANESMIYNFSSNTNGINNTFIWIYISNDTTMFLLTNQSIDFTITHSNGQIVKEDLTNIDVCISSSLILKYFTKFPEGLYKITVNQGFIFELFFYLPTENVYDLDSINSFKTSTFYKALSFIIPKELSDKSTASLFSSIKLQTGKSTTPIRIIQETTRTKNASFLPVNVDLSNSTVGTAKSTSDDSKESIIQYEQSTQTSNAFSDKIEEGGTHGSRKTDVSDPNRMFKAIVEIVQSADGRKDILIDESNRKEVSKYTYTYNVNDYYGPERRGKNPVAIIASLISAILAVGAIILMFLLKDFFSHRQNIRNTRIRPFISHY